VVRADPDAPGDTVLVEAMDPQIMVRIVDQPGLRDVADQATAKLKAAINVLDQTVEAR
jgi:hypothetical protein